MSDSRILFYDPDPRNHAPVVNHLHKMGLEATVCASSDLLNRLHLNGQSFDLAVVGTSLGNGTVNQAINTLRQTYPEMVMICATEGEDEIDEIAESVGAEEVILRPYSLPQLEGAVRMGLELHRLRDEARRLRELIEKRNIFHGLVGGSQPMVALYRYLEQIAANVAPILIHSEPGTEIQETILAIHRSSQKFAGMIKRLDASYLDAEELTGFIRQASINSPGILWIDNIERLNAPTQDALLNLLSGEGSIRGWRLITSSDHDLDAAVEQGRFSRDLYFRINVFNVRIPPLRERLEDLPLLAADRLRSQTAHLSGNKRLSYQALMVASAYGWPRNVAEFDAAIQHACDRTKGEVIEPEAFPPSITSQASLSRKNVGRSLREAKSQFELQYYRDLLTQTRGNMSLAAKISKVGRPYLYKKIRECNLDPETFRV